MTRKVNVAITGTLSKPRIEIATLINATTNGLFVESVTYETHYLIATLLTSQKAKKAAVIGVTVIVEPELNEFLASGSFKHCSLPQRPKHDISNLPEISWDRIYENPDYVSLGYVDASGRKSLRPVAVTGIGHTIGKIEVQWLGGYDDSGIFKTWRRDRILSLEKLDESALRKLHL